MDHLLNNPNPTPTPSSAPPSSTPPAMSQGPVSSTASVDTSAARSGDNSPVPDLVESPSTPGDSTSARPGSGSGVAGGESGSGGARAGEDLSELNLPGLVDESDSDQEENRTGGYTTIYSQRYFFCSFFRNPLIPSIPFPPRPPLSTSSASTTRASALLSPDQRADRASAAERSGSQRVTGAAASSSTLAVSTGTATPSERWRHTTPVNNNNNNNNNSTLPAGALAGAGAGTSAVVSSEDEFRSKCVDLLKDASSFREHVRYRYLTPPSHSSLPPLTPLHSSSYSH